MNRKQLEHIIRAGGSVAAVPDLIVVGSQAILGAFPDAPPELLVSMEADVYPLHGPEKADLIDGSIGELSPFHEAFGYYAHGVGPDTAVLPSAWKARLVKVGRRLRVSGTLCRNAATHVLAEPRSSAHPACPP
jgi:hypothetical protein